MKQGDRWAIFYTNDSVFSSEDGTPWDAPRRSVQCVVSCKNKEEKDWYCIQQIDRFYYEPEHGGWNDCTDEYSMYDHMIRTKHPLVIFGRMLSDSQWKDAFARVVKWNEVHKLWLTGMTDDRPAQNY
jgi:hypothetical protein